MKKIKVTEKSGASIEYINDGEVLNRLHLMGHGQPERPELDADGNPTGNILPAEYTVQITDITAELEQERINAEALKYLADTDWMIIREVDSGVVCPADVKLARAQARAKIVRNN